MLTIDVAPDWVATVWAHTGVAIDSIRIVNKRRRMTLNPFAREAVQNALFVRSIHVLLRYRNRQCFQFRNTT
jgi:hypothetical protein